MSRDDFKTMRGGDLLDLMHHDLANESARVRGLDRIVSLPADRRLFAVTLHAACAIIEGITTKAKTARETPGWVTELVDQARAVYLTDELAGPSALAEEAKNERKRGQMSLDDSQPLPEWRAINNEAKEKRARMSERGRAEYQAVIKAARERQERRMRHARELTRKVMALLFDGHTGYEVAKIVGRPARSIVQFAASRGFVVPLSALLVWRKVTITVGREEALRRAAADCGASAAETLEHAVTFLLDDDAAVLRRVLHIARKTEAA